MPLRLEAIRPEQLRRFCEFGVLLGVAGQHNAAAAPHRRLEPGGPADHRLAVAHGERPQVAGGVRAVVTPRRHVGVRDAAHQQPAVAPGCAARRVPRIQYKNVAALFAQPQR